MTVTSSKTFSQRFLRFPVTRILLALAMVLAVVSIEQGLVVASPVSRLLKNILLGLFTIPLVYWTYHAYVRYVEKRGMTELASTGAVRETVLGAFVGFLLFTSTVVVLALVGVYHMTGLNSLSVLAIPFINSAVGGLFEEILFRGILFRIVEESLGSWLALLISAIIFGLLHLLNENATLIGALAIMFEAGILLAGAYMLTRRLWFAIGIHFAWNFTQSGIFGIAVSGNEPQPGLFQSALQGPDWLTGGAFGAEASIVAVIVCTAAGIYLVYRAVKLGHAIQPYWRRGL